MEISELINIPPLWLDGKKTQGEIVVWAKAELIRNLEGYLFPARAGKEELERVSELIREVTSLLSPLKGHLFLRARDLTSQELGFIKERMLLPHRIDKLTDCLIGESVDILVNQDDHIRIQSIIASLDMKSAYTITEKIDEQLVSELDYAFREEFGYLTSSPASVGTGMSLSYLLHLPGIALTKQMGKIVKKIREQRFSIQGLFRRGEEVEGNLFQLSNQRTLGVSEEDIVETIDRMAREIVEIEEELRDRLLMEAGRRLEDKIWRAYGILKNVRMLPQMEFVNLLSAVRLGVGLGILKKIDLKMINHLLLYTSPAHLQVLKKEKLNPDRDEIERADYIREKMA